MLAVEEVEKQGRDEELDDEFHTNRTIDKEQGELNEKAPTCAAFAEPSSGPEPETPPYMHSFRRALEERRRMRHVVSPSIQRAG